MGFYRGPKIIMDGLTFAIDAASARSYPGSGNDIFNLMDSSVKMSLYGNTSYGSIGSGVVTLTASGNADTDGCLLRSTSTLSTTLNNNFTTSGWLYRTTTDSAELMSYRETWQRLALEIIDTGITFKQRETVDANSNGSYDTFSTSASVTNSRNIWEHFALSKEGDQWSFYKNGVLIVTNTFTMTETVSGTGFHIGAAWSDDDYLGRGMNGKVGSVQHYTKALSAAEISQNFNAQKSRFI
jgi:hypothetical protein